jgi:hypothetical protein
MSVKEIKNKYFATKDYSLFKKSRGNREVDHVHVERIKRLIADKDTKAAITVNKNYEVIDGQHTLQARKELGLEVYFIISESDDALDTARMNTGKRNWNLDNFLKFHCDRNRQYYKICRSKMEQFGMPVAETLALLNGKATVFKDMTEDFKLGNFSIPSGNIAKFDRIAKEMTHIAKHIDPSATKLKRQLIRAYLILCKHPKFSFDRLKSAMRSKGGKLSAVTSKDEYIEQLDRVYNGGLTRDKKVDLLKFALDRDFDKREDAA